MQSKRQIKPLSQLQDPLIDSLFTRFKNQELAHFYLVNAHPSQNSPSAFLELWILSFLLKVATVEQNILTLDELQRILEIGHQDLLWIKKDPDDKNYKISDGELDEVFSFCAAPPGQWKNRFVIIPEAQLITPLYSNKLLKTFEEPFQNVTIFLLAPKQTPVLATIASRAIKLNLTQPSSLTWNQVSQDPVELSDPYKSELQTKLTSFWNNELELFEMVSFITQKSSGADHFLELVLDLAQTKKSFELKQFVLDETQWFSHARIFSNPTVERVSQLLMGLKSHFSPPLPS